jgi:hypothetical protein
MCRYLSKMRKHFDKSSEIDADSQGRLLRMIEAHDGAYSKREKDVLEGGKKMLDVFAQQKSKELKMASSTTPAKIAFKDRESHAYGWSSAVVRASPTQVRARQHERERGERMRGHVRCLATYRRRGRRGSPPDYHRAKQPASAAEGRSFFALSERQKQARSAARSAAKGRSFLRCAR